MIELLIGRIGSLVGEKPQNIGRKPENRALCPFVLHNPVRFLLDLNSNKMHATLSVDAMPVTVH